MALERYAAFLRGVSPMNASMPRVKDCFESAGFTEVKTLLSSGNVVFSARRAPETTLQRKAEKALSAGLGRTFLTIVRSLPALEAMLSSDPFAPFRLPPHAKRIVTFLLDQAATNVALPVENDGARILASTGRELFSAYVPSPRGPVFMTLIEKNFGQQLTTRTWDTCKKVRAALGAQATRNGL